MTITTSINKFRYEGNGVTDTFAFNGRIFNASDIVVEIITRATDVLVETLTIVTDYTVVINSEESASVIVGGAKIPSSLQDIQIRRVLAKTQTLNLPTGTVFPAISVENALDRVTALTQDITEILDRTLTLSVTSSDTAPTIGSLTANEVVFFDGTSLITNGLTATELLALASITADITTVAAIDTQITAVAADSTDIGIVATNIGSVNTVAADIAAIIAAVDLLTSFLSNNNTFTGDNTFDEPVTIGAVEYTNVDGTAGQALITDGAGNAAFGALPDEFDINDLTTTTPAVGDFLPFADITDENNPKKATIGNILNLVPAYVQPTTAGVVGTYMYARNDPAAIVSFGSTVAGSSLRPTSGGGTIPVGSTQSGTWRCMGMTSNTGANEVVATVWLRIS